MSYYFPVLGDYRISSGFGPRDRPGGFGSANHAGIDIAAITGTPVVAPIGGEVIFSGVRGGYGNQVQIRGADGLTHSFSHLDASLVRRGMNIDAGQQLGTVGATGRVTGSHLHYETRDAQGRAINPQGVLTQARQAAQGALSQGMESLQNAARGALESNPVTGAILGVTDGLGLTGDCGWLCQIKEWIKDSGFFQRIALALFAFIVLFAAFYMMKGKEIMQAVAKKGS